MRASRFVVPAAVLVAMLAAPVPHTAAADPDSMANLRKLTKQAAQLNKLYRGRLESLEDTRLAAKKATDRAAGVRAALAAAQVEVSRTAETSYIGGPLDVTRLLSLEMDPYVALGHAANTTYLADERVERLSHMQTLAADAKKAKKAADAKIADLQKDIKAMQSKRRGVEKLLAKYGFQTPSGSGGLTPRMVSVRDQIMQNFPMPYGVGCLRQGDPGEHGKGRACDFMMSGGGSVASGADLDRGDALAQWAIDNGSRLGIMYIIWKQRYYDIRTGGGWDPMSDRGGTTANHYDHVHISVF